MTTPIIIEATIDASDFELGIKQLLGAFDQEAVMGDLEIVAEELIRRSIDAPIPSDERHLANSGTVVPDKKKSEVRFGFNRVYAAFQDQPGKTGTVTVRPRLKKWLFIPLNQKARRTHRLGNNPQNEGLVFGGFVEQVGGGGPRKPIDTPADYVLAKKAIIPIKPYGSAIGPNHYFSETVRRNVTFVFEALRTLTEKRVGSKLPRAGPGGAKKRKA